jgi:hypothetical protein
MSLDVTPRDDWLALDPQVRKAVRQNARRLRAHPDPGVAAAAERYARHVLDGRPGRRAMRLLTVFVVAGVLGGLVAWSSSAGGQGTAGTTVLASLGLVFLAAVIIRQLRVALLHRMDLVGRLALVPAAVGGPADGQGGADAFTLPAHESAATLDVVVRYDRGRVLRQLGLALGLACVEQAVALWLAVPAALVLFESLTVVMIVLAVMLAVRVLRWGPPGRPVLQLDASGLHLPRYRYTLPWAQLAEIRLIPLHIRRRHGQPTVIVSFLPADPGAALRDLRSKGAGRRLEKTSRLYGTPLSFADQLMDQTAEQIAAAATRFAAVPVRRY